jgi:hypothetical protein
MVRPAMVHDILVSPYPHPATHTTNGLLSFVPETRLLTLEQLDDVFSQPTRQFWKWVIYKEGKWAINRLRWWKPHPGKRPQLYESVQKGSAPTRTSSTRENGWEEMQDMGMPYNTGHRERDLDEVQDMSRRQR